MNATDYQLSPAEMRLLQAFRRLDYQDRAFYGRLLESRAGKQRTEQNQKPALRLIAGGAP